MKGKIFLYVKLLNLNFLIFIFVNIKYIIVVIFFAIKDFVYKGDYIRDFEKM